MTAVRKIATAFHVVGGSFFVGERGDHAGIFYVPLAKNTLLCGTQVERTLNIHFFTFIGHGNLLAHGTAMGGLFFVCAISFFLNYRNLSC